MRRDGGVVFALHMFVLLAVHAIHSEASLCCYVNAIGFWDTHGEIQDKTWGHSVAAAKENYTGHKGTEAEHGVIETVRESPRKVAHVSPERRNWRPGDYSTWHTFDDKGCAFEDVIGQIFASVPLRGAGGNATILLIGDSNDRRTLEAFCWLGAELGFVARGGTGDEMHFNGRHHGNFRTSDRKQPQAMVCSNGHFKIIWFSIFGMVRPSQLQFARSMVEGLVSKAHNESNLLETAYRLKYVLPEFLQQSSEMLIITFNSGLWDLSEPVTIGDVSVSFLRDYISALIKHVRMLRVHYPASQIYIRNVIGTAYGDQETHVCPGHSGAPESIRNTSGCTALTRTRRNIQAINNAVDYADPREHYRHTGNQRESHV